VKVGTEELLSFRRAAAALGWPDTWASGLRLKRAVLAREKQLGREIARRVGRTHLRVTLGALYRALPELRREKSSENREHVREYLAGIDDRIYEHAARAVQELVEPQIKELRGRLEETRR
jgi:hypothetical protein